MANFIGFTSETIQFFDSLIENNSQKWFLLNENQYNHHVISPAEALVETLGSKLEMKVPGLSIEPKIGGSILIQQREAKTRLNSRPYKTHLGIAFFNKEIDWGNNINNTLMYYFELTVDHIFIGVGIKEFSTSIRKNYRNLLLENEEFRSDIGNHSSLLKKNNFIDISGKLARIPSELKKINFVDTDAPLRKGLFLGRKEAITDIIYDSKLISKCLSVYLPLHEVYLSLRTLKNK